MTWANTILDGAEEGFKVLPATQKPDVCTIIHKLLDIIGSDSNYKKEIARACNLLSSNNCTSHAACSSVKERRGHFG